MPSYVSSDDDALPEERSGSQEGASVLREKRVVVVEDDDLTQILIKRILKQAGLLVVGSASNGEQGVEVVLRERPALVLMDMRMPGPCDGIEAARRILAEYQVCLVLITAYPDEQYQEAAEAIGVCGYIVKPVATQTLLSRLEAAFAKFGAR